MDWKYIFGSDIQSVQFNIGFFEKFGKSQRLLLYNKLAAD